MKKLLLAVAFFSFVGLTYANPCEDGKKCDKKECTKAEKKECSSKDAKKASCSKDKAAGKSCCASKAKTTDEKKGE